MEDGRNFSRVIPYIPLVLSLGWDQGGLRIPGCARTLSVPRAHGTRTIFVSLDTRGVRAFYSFPPK